MNGRAVRRPDLTIATEDHNVPTEHIDQPIADPVSRRQVETLRTNTAEFGITNYPMTASQICTAYSTSVPVKLSGLYS